LNHNLWTKQEKIKQKTLDPAIDAAPTRWTAPGFCCQWGKGSHRKKLGSTQT
jgi:hypothetical protein